MNQDRILRAARRAGVHLLKASIETLKAVEAVVEELKAHDPPRSDESTERLERIDVQ